MYHPRLGQVDMRMISLMGYGTQGHDGVLQGDGGAESALGRRQVNAAQPGRAEGA